MKVSKSSTTLPADESAVQAELYVDSPIHYAVATADHATLNKIVSSLPKLSDPTRIHTESDAIAEERLAEQISRVLNNRDNPLKETPLHVAVRVNDVAAARAIAAAGANINLRNTAGWTPLQEAILRQCKEIAPILCHHQHQNNWAKWRRRRPRIIAALSRMRDFYMEISFSFESFLPFVAKIAPSDTYKIWKRGGNLRADFSMSGYEGMNIRRGNNSFLFVTENLDVFQQQARHISMRQGTALAVKHDTKEVMVASPKDKEDNAPLSEAEISKRCNVGDVDVRPGMDVSKAQLVSCKNWRRQDKTEKVGEWKARVYEMHNVILSLRSRKVNPAAQNLSTLPQVTETQMSASLRPMVWLTDQFPLMIEDFHRLLDILSRKIKAVRQLKEVLNTTFPPGTFPVKVAIPVLPAVKVVMTITKFVDLQPTEEFYTPPSSPKHSEDEKSNEEENISVNNMTYLSFPSSSQRKGRRHKHKSSSDKPVVDPFMIPQGYKWISISDVKTGKLFHNTSS